MKPFQAQDLQLAAEPYRFGHYPQEQVFKEECVYRKTEV